MRAGARLLWRKRWGAPFRGALFCIEGQEDWQEDWATVPPPATPFRA